MKIAIIDDQFEDRERVSGFLRSYYTSIQSKIPLSIYAYENGVDFIRIFKKNAFDLIIIDYYMDNLSGLDVAREIRKSDASAILIFTTASPDFAIDCYKVKASGYLVKPFGYEDFSEILSLLDIKEIHDRQFIEIVNGADQENIILKDIIYCDIYGHYTRIHTKSAGMKRFRMSFSRLCCLLEAYSEFLICYRGCLINLNHVEEIEELNIRMSNGERIPFRKKERTKMIRAYSEYLFERIRERKL